MKKISKTSQDKKSIVVYKISSDVEIELKLKKETVWLDAVSIGKIFGVQRSAIVKHINNIYKTKELEKKSTCSILEQVAADGKYRKINFYNLDMIISVGYRVNSKKATEFRIWATKVLKNYLMFKQVKLTRQKEKFKELQKVVDFFHKKSQMSLLQNRAGDLLALLADYTKTLSLLEQYDEGELKSEKGTCSEYILTYPECLKIIGQIKKELIKKSEKSDLFGVERAGSLEGIIKGLYQTFDGKELYPTVEEKAAHLLYFVIKDHPFVDGNKRIASFLFVYYLDKTNSLYKKTGEKKFNDNALAALSLFVAESSPKDKKIMIQIIKALIGD